MPDAPKLMLRNSDIKFKSKFKYDTTDEQAVKKLASI